MINKHQGPSHLIEQLRKAGNTDSHIAKLLNVSGVLNSHGLGWTEGQVAQVNTARVPFGYRWENGELVRDPAEYPVREIMVKLREAGLTYSQIAQEIKGVFRNK